MSTQQKSQFEQTIDAFVADGRLAYMDGEGLKKAHEADKAVAPANIVRKFAVWIALRDHTYYLSSSLFDTAEEAVKHFKRMPNYCRENGDEVGAREWEGAKNEPVPVDVPEIPQAAK